jgi:competence protein ComEC
LHIGLITLLVELLLRRIGLRKVARAVIALAFLVVYALLVEQRAPTLRASLMIAMYLLARILDRGHTPLNSLGGVALILLFVRPAWLFDSEFQLSFSAALLIVGVAVPILERTTEPFRRALRQIDNVMLDDYFSPRLAQTRLDLRAAGRALNRRIALLRRYPFISRSMVITPVRLGVWTVNILIFSSVLQLGLLLPMAEIFHRVTFAGVGLNALAVPVMTLLLALALPINLLAVVSPTLAAWPAKLLSLVMTALFSMTHLPGLAEWLSYRVPAPPVYVACGFCVAFLVAGCTLRFARRWTALALAACAVFVGLVAAAPFSPRLPVGVFQVTALDCGQGDATFLVLPDGTTVLVNAGGTPARSRGLPSGQRWNPGEDIVSPYLWSRRLKRIDIVVVTNGSETNIEAVRAVLANFNVGEFWFTPDADGQRVDTLLGTVAKLRIPTRMLPVGGHSSIGPASIRALQYDGGQADAEGPTLQLDFKGTRFTIAGGTVTVEDSADRGFVQTNNPGLQLIGDDPTSSPDRDSDNELSTRVAIVSPGGESGLKESVVVRKKHQSGQESDVKVFHTSVDGATSLEWRDGSISVCSFTNPIGEILTSRGWQPNPSGHSACKP